MPWRRRSVSRAGLCKHGLSPDAAAGRWGLCGPRPRTRPCPLVLPASHRAAGTFAAALTLVLSPLSGQLGGLEPLAMFTETWPRSISWRSCPLSPTGSSGVGGATASVFMCPLRPPGIGLGAPHGSRRFWAPEVLAVATRFVAAAGLVPLRSPCPAFEEALRQLHRVGVFLGFKPSLGYSPGLWFRLYMTLCPPGPPCRLGGRGPPFTFSAQAMFQAPPEASARASGAGSGLS